MPINSCLRLCIRCSPGLIRRGIHIPRAKVQSGWRLSDDDVSRFESAFPEVVAEVTRTNNKTLQPVMDYYKNLLEFNVPNGKKQRGLLALTTYRMLSEKNSEKQTEKQVFGAYIMGWCLEIFQAASLIADDMMDQSLTRRGQKCWYLHEGVGLSKAINDVYFLENCMYRLLKKYFGEEDFYSSLIDLFYQNTFTTLSGQSLDLQLSNNHISVYTEENYKSLCWHKTSAYTFHLPVASAMHLAGVADRDLLEMVKEIVAPIGQLFQMQDDYLDLFGDSAMTGKVGTDIKEGKCTWFIVKALQMLDKDEAKLIETCYGSDDPESSKRVFNKFVELHLEKLYLQSQDDMYQSIVDAISRLPNRLPAQLFHICLNALYGRQM